MRVAVVIPCYKAKSSIVPVIRRIGDEVCAIYVVDDCCPEHTADFLEANAPDPRLKIIRHEKNKGVGGAVISGYRQAHRRWYGRLGQDRRRRAPRLS